MNWWQITVTIIGTIVALLVGLVLGRVLSGKRASPFAHKNLVLSGGTDQTEPSPHPKDSLHTLMKEHQSLNMELKTNVAIEKARQHLIISPDNTSANTAVASQGGLATEAANKIKEAQEGLPDATQLPRGPVEHIVIKPAEQEVTIPIEGATGGNVPIMPAASIGPNILAEIYSNLKIATAPRPQPQPFFTAAWENKQSEINDLTEEIIGELNEAYTDIRLANNIVWLVTEVGARGTEFDENYRTLCSKIAERLKKNTQVY